MPNFKRKVLIHLNLNSQPSTLGCNVYTLVLTVLSMHLWLRVAINMLNKNGVQHGNTWLRHHWKMLNVDDILLQIFAQKTILEKFLHG